MEKSSFKHKAEIRVRNYEVDWQGIVHNAVYLQYFEVGRIEYLRALGMTVDLTSIQHEARIVLARNEVDYRSPARFDEAITIWSRIVYIRDSSFAFEGMMEASRDNRLIAENLAVHVWLDAKSGRPRTVPDDFRSMVQKYEGTSFANLQPPLMT